MALQACTSGVGVPKTELSRADGDDDHGNAAAQGWVRSVMPSGASLCKSSLSNDGKTGGPEVERGR